MGKKKTNLLKVQWRKLRHVELSTPHPCEKLRVFVFIFFFSHWNLQLVGRSILVFPVIIPILFCLFHFFCMHRMKISSKQQIKVISVRFHLTSLNNNMKYFARFFLLSTHQDFFLLHTHRANRWLKYLKSFEGATWKSVTCRDTSPDNTLK